MTLSVQQTYLRNVRREGKLEDAVQLDVVVLQHVGQAAFGAVRRQDVHVVRLYACANDRVHVLVVQQLHLQNNSSRVIKKRIFSGNREF